MTTRTIIAIVVVAAIAVLIVPAIALIIGMNFGATTPESISPSSPAEYTKGFVDQAVDHYNSLGLDATLAYYNSPQSVDGEWYVFIIGRDGRIAAHATQPERVGLAVAVQVDTNGYNYGADIAGASGEGGWVDYTYFNAVSGAEEMKHSWVVGHDGLVFGSGWYEK